MFCDRSARNRSLEIIGTDAYNYNRQKAILRLTERCVNLSTEGFDVEEFITDDTNKKVWQRIDFFCCLITL